VFKKQLLALALRVSPTATRLAFS